MISSSTDARAVRRFGLVATGACAVATIVNLWLGALVHAVPFGCLCALGLSMVFFPERTRPLYNGWHRVGTTIGTIVTAIVFAVLYFVVITPSAWIMKLSGRPSIPLRPTRTAGTYWVNRSEPIQPRERFYKRF